MSISIKYNLKFKHAVALAVVGTLIILVIGYTLLAVRVYLAGMDNVMANNLTLATRQFSYEQACDDGDEQCDQLYPSQRRALLIDGAQYNVSLSWAHQPDEVRAIFPEEPKQLDQLQRALPRMRDFDSSGYFVLKTRFRDEDYFVSYKLQINTVPKMFTDNARVLLATLLGIAFITIVCLALVFRWLGKNFAKPIEALGRWADNLDENNLNDPIPEFFYPELNEFALLVRSSLESAKERIERERNFLQYASHELRTPIAVLRNNMELITKLRNQPSLQNQALEVRILERIDRASITMKNLCETLLWLSYDEIRDLPTDFVQVDALTTEVIDDLKYLLNGKDVEIDIDLMPLSLKIAETPARIVLCNLVRNAFQHTWQGRIVVKLESNTLTVVNSYVQKTKGNTELGFGLGLRLTHQLSEKLAWQVSGGECSIGYKVTLTMA